MWNKILVLAPHTDDGELGCGGLIHRYRDSHVYYVALSSCEESLPQGYEQGTLVNELKCAAEILQVNKFTVLDFPVRNFNKHRQRILDELIKIRNSYDPDLVLIPHTADLHQDHGVLAAEAVRAFKKTSILAYEMPWNNLSFETEIFIKLSDEDVSAKERALSCYVSQSDKQMFRNGFIRSLAVVRGTTIGSEFAEAFKVIRIIK